MVFLSLLDFQERALEVVDHPADGLDVGVLGLPLVVAAVVAALHHVHPTPEVGLLVHDPAEDTGAQSERGSGARRSSLCVRLTRRRRTP